MKSFYDVLGVSKFASDTEIKKAFILRSKMMHPDRFNQTSQKAEWDMANEMIKELNNAYAVLKDPISRSTYDRTIADSYSQQSTPPPQRSTQSSSPPKPPSRPEQPQYSPPPSQTSVRMPQWIYNLIILCVIGLVAKGCESIKSIAPRTPSNLSASSSSTRIPESPISGYTPAPVNLMATPVPTPKDIIPGPLDYPEPVNGFVFKNRLSNNGHGKLRVSNGCPSHSVVKLVDTSLNQAVYAGFVRANCELSITSIPDGKYRLLFASGHGWDEIDGRFTVREGSSEFDEPMIYNTTPINDGVRTGVQYDSLSVTLNPVIGGTAKTESISTSDFEKY